MNFGSGLWFIWPPDPDCDFSEIWTKILNHNPKHCFHMWIWRIFFFNADLWITVQIIYMGHSIHFQPLLGQNFNDHLQICWFYIHHLLYNKKLQNQNMRSLRPPGASVGASKVSASRPIKISLGGCRFVVFKDIQKISTPFCSKFLDLKLFFYTHCRYSNFIEAVFQPPIFDLE